MRARIMTQVVLLASGMVAAVSAGVALADQGSGQSWDARNDDYVVICHYDRNQRGRNAGPHTITIHSSALDHHLANHVKSQGFDGDDYIGKCGEGPPDDSTLPQ